MSEVDNTLEDIKRKAKSGALYYRVLDAQQDVTMTTADAMVALLKSGMIPENIHPHIGAAAKHLVTAAKLYQQEKKSLNGVSRSKFEADKNPPVSKKGE